MLIHRDEFPETLRGARVQDQLVTAVLPLAYEATW